MAFTQSTYFLCLSVIATNLLWGISLYNGTVVALLQASLRGMFEDGTPFVTTYTGIKMLDFPISLLVAFFFYGTNGSHPLYQLFLVDAYAALQPAFVWLYVERCRMGAQPWAVAQYVLPNHFSAAHDADSGFKQVRSAGAFCGSVSAPPSHCLFFSASTLAGSMACGPRYHQRMLLLREQLPSATFWELLCQL